MATLGQPEIHVQPEVPGPTEDEILRWLSKISNDYIDAGSLDIMKLSMRSELTQEECDKVKSASDLYHALAKHYTDPKVLLARFIYALEKLGHRRYGHRAVRELSSNHSLPPAFANLTMVTFRPAVDRNEFILLQRLAVLCCMLPEGCYPKFTSHFAKKKLSANPSIYQTPCDILTKLLLEHILTTDNLFNEIEEALIKVELSESQIKEYFDNYEKIATFERLRTSSFSPSKASSDYSSPDQRKKKFSPTEKARPYSPYSSAGSGSSSPVPKSTSSTSSTSSAHRDPVPTENTPLIGPTGGGQEQNQGKGAHQPANVDIRPGDTKKNRYRRCLKILCCTAFVVLLVLATGAALLTGFAVRQYRSNQPTTERYHENSSVVLTEVDHFFTKSLTVTEDTQHLDDFHHDIEVHHAECKCSDLVTLRTYTLNGSDLSPIPPVYALAGSSISLHICGSTNATTDSERLEIVLRNHIEEPNLNEVPYRVNFFHPGLDGKWQCKNIIFHLPENGYYTLIFLPNLDPLSPCYFEYEVIYGIQAIDSHLLAEHTIANYTLRADQESYKFFMSSGIEKQKSCFVAVIRENPNTAKGDVHIQLDYGNRKDGFIAGVIMLSAIALVSIVLLSVFVGRAFKHAKVE